MRLLQVPAADFDLAQTLDSGQVFHWQKIGDEFWGTIGDLPVGVEQHGDVLKIKISATKLDGLKPSSSQR
jgi:N-glycosylase/DNA lyase